MNVWLDEWVVEWMTEWVDGWLVKWLNGWANEWLIGWLRKLLSDTAWMKVFWWVCEVGDIWWYQYISDWSQKFSNEFAYTKSDQDSIVARWNLFRFLPYSQDNIIFKNWTQFLNIVKLYNLCWLNWLFFVTEALLVKFLVQLMWSITFVPPWAFRTTLLQSTSVECKRFIHYHSLYRKPCLNDYKNLHGKTMLNQSR